MISKTQKKYLKALANPLKPLVIIGKGGLNESVIDSIDECLNAHELVKIDVLKTCEISTEEIAIEVASKTKCEVIQLIGRKIVIYRFSKENNNIILPR